MKKLIIANWKMNPITREKAERLFALEDKGFKNLEIVICAPFVWLLLLSGKKVKLGAQNCHFEKQGAYTGEISAWLLKDIGVEYVIVGHSERREKDEIVNKKIQACFRAKLKPVLCVENEEQLKARLKDINVRDIAIAYEPAWAISPGNACSPERAKQMQILIRRILTQLYSRKIAEKIKILYGGSVSEKNAADYTLDGFLIGGASLDAEKFIRICDTINQKN